MNIVSGKQKEWQCSCHVKIAIGTTPLKEKIFHNYLSEHLATGKAKTEKKG